MTAWAFATAGFFDKQLFESISREICLTRILSQFNPQELSMTAWAFATAGFFDEQLSESISRETLHKLSQFNPQDLAMAGWAFATVFQQRLSQLTPQELANAEWATREQLPRSLQPCELRDFEPVAVNSIVKPSELDSGSTTVCQLAIDSADSIAQPAHIVRSESAQSAIQIPKLSKYNTLLSECAHRLMEEIDEDVEPEDPPENEGALPIFCKI